ARAGGRPHLWRRPPRLARAEPAASARIVGAVVDRRPRRPALFRRVRAPGARRADRTASLAHDLESQGRAVPARHRAGALRAGAGAEESNLVRHRPYGPVRPDADPAAHARGGGAAAEVWRYSLSVSAASATRRRRRNRTHLPEGD